MLSKNFMTFVFVSFAVLLASQFFQYFTISHNIKLIKENKDAVIDSRLIYLNGIEESEERMLEHIGNVEDEIFSVIDKQQETIHARIDILDSGVDSEKKRRMLVMRVRQAITENTNIKINIRDLNRIAIATIDYSFQYNLKISHILAQIKTESNFNKGAVSRAGAEGLMQIMPKTMKDEIERDLGAKLNAWRIYDNIHAGCYYMSKMLLLNDNHYNDALRSYNFGYANVLKVKAGEEDFSLRRVVIEDEKEVEYLVDRRGEFVLDENGDKRPIKLEDKYPRETRNYVIAINDLIKKFEKYGFE